MKKEKLTKEDFLKSNSLKELFGIIEEKGIDFSKANYDLAYYKELQILQIELVKWQKWIHKTGKKVAIIFEGRDAAGKGGSIRRFMEHLNPRTTRLVALDKPTELEKGQWYFNRYIKHLPNPGEVVFFDRSWYNRAIVEPVMGFCTKEQYDQYMNQVSVFENMIYEDGLIIIKFWLSISKEEQARRFNSREKTPLKRWKFSEVDKKGQELWKEYSKYKEMAFSKTHTPFSPWINVKTNKKKQARLEIIRHVLSMFDYENKDDSKTSLVPDPNVIFKYYRENIS
ncbi:MAG: polyphosphate kinase 2 [Flavobacteriaceae bacterium]|nr:polyphosphate kinase 2 [Flavobacteriaceae bacterium]